MRQTLYPHPPYELLTHPQKQGNPLSDHHPTAQINPRANIAPDVKIGAYAVIEKDVSIGAGCVVGPFTHILPRTHLGEHNHIGSHCTLGVEPQDLKYKGEPSSLEIGDHNVIREYTNISIGTAGGGMVTRVGGHNLFMVRSHIGHDAAIGHHNILANGTSLGGHVGIGNHALLGGHVAVHQHCQIGDYSMVSGGSNLSQDLPPCVLGHGHRAIPKGLNLVRLQREKFSAEQISEVKKIYRMIYGLDHTFEKACELIAQLPSSPITQMFLDFFPKVTRGLIRG